MEQQQQRAVFQVHREITPLHRGEKKKLKGNQWYDVSDNSSHNDRCRVAPTLQKRFSWDVRPTCWR